MGIGTSVTKLFRFGLRGGMRSIEINREDFRRYLARKHKIYVTDFRQLRQLPVERLDAVATILIRDSQRLALLEGAGFFGAIVFLIGGNLLGLAVAAAAAVAIIWQFPTANRIRNWITAQAEVMEQLRRDAPSSRD